MYLLQYEVHLWSYCIDTRHAPFAYLWLKTVRCFGISWIPLAEKWKSSCPSCQSCFCQRLPFRPMTSWCLGLPQHSPLTSRAWLSLAPFLLWVGYLKRKESGIPGRCLECLLISRSKQVSWGIFSVGRKRNPSSHFLTWMQYTHYLGRKAAVLTTVLDKCGSFCCCCLLFRFFQLEWTFWVYSFSSFKMVCCIFKYNRVAVLNSGIIVINCSSQRTKRWNSGDSDAYCAVSGPFCGAVPSRILCSG